jgi:hypothetical protein
MRTTLSSRRILVVGAFVLIAFVGRALARSRPAPDRDTALSHIKRHTRRVYEYRAGADGPLAGR